MGTGTSSLPQAADVFTTQIDGVSADAAANINHLQDAITALGSYLGVGPVFYNVRGAQYNAKGNGTTVDTVALQNAINDATATSPNGGTVFLPPGIYPVTASGGPALTLKANVNFRGCGRGVTTVKGSYVFSGANLAVLYVATNQSAVSIVDVTVQGTAVANLTNGLDHAGIFVDTGVTNLDIAMVSVSAVTRGIILWGPVTTAQLSNVVVTSVYRASAGVLGIGLHIFQNCLKVSVVNLVTDGTDGTGYLLDAGSSNFATAASGVDINASNVTVRNYAQSYDSPAIEFQGSLRSTLCSFTVDSGSGSTGGGEAIQISQDQNGMVPTDNVITDGTCYGISAHGIVLAGCIQNTVDTVRFHNLGMKVPAGNVYGVLFTFIGVTHGSQSPVTDNTVSNIDVIQDAATGKYTYGVEFDGSSVNCYRNRVIGSRLGSPATGLSIYAAPNAPNVGVNANVVSGDENHLGSAGAAPAVSTGSNIGAGGTVAIFGTDVAGYVQIGTGTGPTAGQLVHVTFAQAYPGNGPRVQLTAMATSATEALSKYAISAGNIGPAGFDIYVASPPAASTTYLVDYLVRQA